jgi:hypothetical protein
MGGPAHIDGTHGTDPLPDDYPVPTDRLLAQRDLRYGQMAVVIHRREDWPSGPVCRNCHGAWPCRLHRWGLQVLWSAGWSTTDIVHLVRQADSGQVPW